MLISDAYSWGPNNILEVALIPYYGYICSDDDGPGHYEFNPHPYGVVPSMLIIGMMDTNLCMI